MWAETMVMAGKDLRIELRSRVGLWQVAPFAFTMLLLFAFALDPDRGILQRAAPGLFWVAVLFSCVLLTQRTFAIETPGGSKDGLLSLPISSAAIFAGKALALGAQLLALQAMLWLAAVFLYGMPVAGAAVVLAVALAATACLACASTLYGGLVCGGSGRETLLPLLFLPAVAPVLIAATRATEHALASDFGLATPWIALLGLFSILYLGMGLLLFSSALEDA